MNKEGNSGEILDGQAPPGYSLAASNDAQMYSTLTSPEESKNAGKSKFYWLMLAVLTMIGAGFLIIILAKKSQNGAGPQPPVNPKVFHLIPHSHDDLGWLITERDYSDSIVSHVIRTSSRYLLDNPNNKFSFCNIGFLRHWTDSNPNNIGLFKQAVATGRMEILNGGYSVHDNAAVYFDDIVSTYEYAREFLWQQFQYIPRTGWLIDPFGLSLTTSRLYAEMGYDQYVTNRLPDWEREQMRQQGQLQKYWLVRNQPQYTTWISEMADHYQTPDPFNVDFGLDGSNDPYPDLSILSSQFTLSDNMTSYLDTIWGYESWFPTRNVMLPFGGDFYFRDFNSTIQIVDVIFIYMASNSWTGQYANNMTFIVSSASEYFAAVHKDAQAAKTVFTNKTGDFFPYVNNPNISDPTHQSWTGYFVTNPYAKRIIRTFSQATRGMKNLLGLFSLRTLGTKDDISMEEIASNTEFSHFRLGINTHHDTITGTSRETAADSYVTITDDQFSSLNTTYNLFVTKYINMDKTKSGLTCALLNPYREFLGISQSGTYLFISQGGQANKLVRFLSPFKSVTMTNTLTNATVTPIASHQNPNGTWEHAVQMSLLTGQASIFNVDAQDTDLTTSVVMTEGTVYTEVIAGVTVKFSIQDGVISFADNTNSFGVQLKRYSWDPLSKVSNSSQGKYLFTASSPAVTLIPDSKALTYTLQKSGTSLDINVEYLGKLIFLNFNYIPSAPAHQRYSVRADMD